MNEIKATHRKLPATRPSVTHKFSICGHEGYLTVGFFEDGTPGELFLTMAKEGSTIGGLMNCIGILTSLALQSGVSLDVLTKKLSHVRFEPRGQTNNPNIPDADSVIDYIFRWLENVSPEKFHEAAISLTTESSSPSIPFAFPPLPPDGDHIRDKQFATFQLDAPACTDCGSITVRNGNCYLCHNCGTSMGCS